VGEMEHVASPKDGGSGLDSAQLATSERNPKKPKGASFPPTLGAPSAP